MQFSKYLNQVLRWTCVFSVLSISLLALQLSAQAQNTGQLQTPIPMPPAPTMEVHDLSQEYRPIHAIIPFEKLGFEWPKKFLELENMIAFEELKTPAAIRGRFLHNRGFWDEKSSPVRLVGLLIFHQKAPENEPRVIYQFATTEFDHIATIFGRPKFAPDGAKVLLLNGSSIPERFNNFGIYFWDFNKRQVTNAVSQASITKETQPTFYQKVLWSPGSQFLSYLRGGNAVGDSDDWTKPYELYVSDTRTQVQRRIATDAGHQWSWTHQGTLLFSYLKPQNIMPVVMGAARPSIYESDTKGSKPVKLFDGGYFAQASPDGQWIAFCDWPGALTDNPNAPKELKENQQRGLFLFHRPTKRRVFVGDLNLPAGQTPLIQWMPDGRSLFVLESRETGERTLQGKIWKMEIEQQTLNPFAELTISGGEGTPLAGKPGYFTLRGTAPDSSRLYLETVAVTDIYQSSFPNVPPMPNTQRTLIAVDAQTGKQTPMAHLTTHIGYDDNWDWHDDSGVNPAFAAAAKVEAKLPLIAIPKK